MEGETPENQPRKEYNFTLLRRRRAFHRARSPSSPEVTRRVLVCYISGFDLRRINDQSTPFTSAALQTYPWARLVNLPSNELFPTLVTGVDPTEHGVWGVRLRPAARRSIGAALLDRMPDGLLTTIQGCLHLWTGSFDLAAVPPRRRRRFEITRMKYKRRINRPEALHRIGNVPTLFDIAGAAQSRYLFDSGYDPERTGSHACERTLT